MVHPSAEGEIAGLSPAERDVLAIAQRAIARCEAGIDDDALALVHDALRAVVRYDHASVMLLDERQGYYRVVWRSGEPLNGTMLVPREGRAASADRGEGEAREEEAPSVVELVTREGSPLERWLYDTGIRSYVAVPFIDARGATVGYLALAHEAAGAPSKGAMPLLTRLARTLAPGVVRG